MHLYLNRFRGLNSLQKIVCVGIMFLSVGYGFRFFPRFSANTARVEAMGAKNMRSLSMTAKTVAQEAISTNTVMVFSKTYCPYCTRAKEALTSLNVKFTLMELDVVKDGAAVQSALEAMTGQRTVPNIFIKGQHVGGCDVTLAKIADGSLQKMLA